MRWQLLVPAAIFVAVPTTAEPQDRWVPPEPALLERAWALLGEVPFVDTHDDLVYSIQEKLAGDPSRADLTVAQPELAADFPRLRKGGIGAQF